MSSKKSNNLPSKKQLLEQLQFLGQMASTETALFHQKAAARYGLGVTDMKAVSALMQEGPMTAGQLAQRLSLTTGAVTSLLDRLEERKVIKRVPHPADRRKVIAKVNPRAFTSNDNVYESIGRSFQKLLQNYSAEQLQFLVDYYKLTIEQTKQEITNLDKNKHSKPGR